jgi:L-ascorbate metabolism protein UlaG (beta-lactamase superfamily)
LSADDALRLFDRLEARYLVPYHWGTFEHVTSGAYDAINRLRHLLPQYSRTRQLPRAHSHQGR